MNASYQRALILHRQGRFADAERELRQALATEPNDAGAHAMLGLCLSDLKRYDDAAAETDAAIGLSPDLPFAHYARAKVLYDRNRYAEAALAIHETIRLDPHDPGAHSLLAGIRLEQRRWADALSAAEAGLAIDPEHSGCVNLRAMALVKLGRRAEAGATIGAALARDPENAVTHANQGWAMLHAGKQKPALEHFREALRIDPELEWAQAGIVEALKARYFVYRWMLLYFLWMSRLSGRAQWGIIVGAWVGYTVLQSVARNNPAIKPWVTPVLVVYITFAALTWLADPLFNLLLRLNRFGKLVLTREQIVRSNIIGSLLLLALAGAGAWLATRRELIGLAAFMTALLIMPISGVFRTPLGWPRWVMMAGTLVLALSGAVGIGTLQLAGEISRDESSWMWGLGNSLLTGYFMGILASIFAPGVLQSVANKK